MLRGERGDCWEVNFCEVPQEMGRVTDNFCVLSLFCDFALDFLLAAVDAVVAEDEEAVAIVSLALFLLDFLLDDSLNSTAPDNFFSLNLILLPLSSLLCSWMTMFSL